MVISMDRWKGKVAVVTGGGSGIGAAVAGRLLDSGLKVACLDFSKENLDQFAKTHAEKSKQFITVQADVTKEEDILTAFKKIKEDAGPVHILVNCAGVFRIGGLTNSPTKFLKDTLDTNVLGLCITTREAIKDMRANNVDGHIVNMNSIWGHGIYNTTVSFMNTYPASKHAVKAIVETLRQELNSMGSKIKVTSISPGYVKTGISAAAFKASGTPTEVIQKIVANTSNRTCLYPEDIADGIMYALSTPPHVQVHELTIKPIQEPE